MIKRMVVSYQDKRPFLRGAGANEGCIRSNRRSSCSFCFDVNSIFQPCPVSAVTSNRFSLHRLLHMPQFFDIRTNRRIFLLLISCHLPHCVFVALYAYDCSAVFICTDSTEHVCLHNFDILANSVLDNSRSRGSISVVTGTALEDRIIQTSSGIASAFVFEIMIGI